MRSPGHRLSGRQPKAAAYHSEPSQSHHPWGHTDPVRYSTRQTDLMWKPEYINFFGFGNLFTKGFKTSSPQKTFIKKKKLKLKRQNISEIILKNIESGAEQGNTAVFRAKTQKSVPVGR
ncbi:hypothetical protein XELAEV_18021764mg [Xenopus laevis]|uniref:Uncharacterized protein n=1 Tax=Xenopus laevis TaxID=8355 RepID=A0A974D3E6_XENLA|nr:hypothetical protein XELAEV_18021764mg [Xenopus laevis]